MNEKILDKDEAKKIQTNNDKEEDKIASTKIIEK